jgi:hypothetical protein
VYANSNVGDNSDEAMTRIGGGSIVIQEKQKQPNPYREAGPLFIEERRQALCGSAAVISLGI